MDRKGQTARIKGGVSARRLLAELDDIIPTRPVLVGRGVTNELRVVAYLGKAILALLSKFVRIQYQTNLRQFSVDIWAKNGASLYEKPEGASGSPATDAIPAAHYSSPN
jgi:hypothetical protein